MSVNSEYIKYGNIIKNFSFHIDRLVADYIISNNERTIYLRTLNEFIKILNTIYNDMQIKSKGKKIIDEIDQTETISENIASLDASTVAHISELVPQNSYCDLIKKIISLSTKTGIYQLDDIFDLLNIDKEKNKQNQLYSILNDIFVPINIKITKLTTDQPYSIEITKYPHELLIKNYMQIKIILYNNEFVYNGYLKYDSVDYIIKTSQILSPYIYDKIKQINRFSTDIRLKYINTSFKTNYNRYLLLNEIITMTKETYIKDIIKEYDHYVKITKLSFRVLMNDEFLNDKITISEQYDIIRLFLVGGTEDNINMAGLLFGLIKDKKQGSILISNIIYKNLNYYGQIKVRKSSSNIKIEMEKLKQINTDSTDLTKELCLNKNIPQNIKKYCMDKINEMKTGNSEYYKQKVYVDILMNYPWKIDEETDVFSKLANDKIKSKEFITNVRTKLQTGIYGHDECKNTMEELIGKWITGNQKIGSGKAIGLYGPPGVGKTLIAKSLGDSLGIPFTQINLGGMEDRCILSGHSYTYSAAQPGLIVRKMIEAGKQRCIMYFDELDKTCTKQGINEIHNVLIHLTDPNTNDSFSDSFFSEVTFPLNNVLFVFSYNDPDKIDKILLDRIEKIEIKPYNISDKLLITRNYLLKNIENEIGFPTDLIDIPDDTIKRIIEQYTFEPGIRELKRKLETIFLKLNLDRIYNRELFKPTRSKKPLKITVTPEYVTKLIKTPSNTIKKIHLNDEIGVINGLYATTYGYGGIIPIIVYTNFIGKYDNFGINITGNQGKVMKESITFAFTTAMNLIKPIYTQQFLLLHKNGLHIHTPDGTTPKDGPSAGAAFTTVFISKIINKKIKKDIGITGEIDVNGTVTAIGGLVYKLKGAEKAGIKTVCYPKENEDDIKKILLKDPSINNLNLVSVSHIKEILDVILLEDDLGTKFNSSVYLV